MSSVLIVLTAADHWTLRDGTEHATGFWANELLDAVAVLDAAGLDLTYATPGGLRPPVDEASLAPSAVGGQAGVDSARAGLDALADQLAAPRVLADVVGSEFDAVFLPGGHGPMQDLAVDPALGALLVSMLDGGKVVAAVCHGPAGLLPAVRPDGEWVFAGRTVSCFTDAEERAGGLADAAPWLLEDRLRAAGADVVTGPAWRPLSVADGTLVTGQNPQSSTEVAQRLVAQLQAA